MSSKKSDFIVSTGKRKRAVATCTLSKGSGVVRINGKPVELYGTQMYRFRMQEPLILAGDLAKGIDIHLTVSGGGIASRTDAARLAIARALSEFKESLVQVFLDYDRTLLVADVRQREPRKPNCRGRARAKRQKSYR